MGKLSTVSEGSERTYSRIVSFLTSSVWAMHPAALATIAAIVAERAGGHRPDVRQIRQRVALGRERRADAEPAPSVPSVAIIPIEGPIVPKADFFTEVSGGASITSLQAQLRAALADGAITAIVLNVDSPGGSADLVPEFAQEILAARGTKPIVAVANTWAASAAYWIASAADELVVTPSGQVGSIGVYTMHEDFSEKLKMLGIDTTLVFAGDYKVEKNPFEPLGEEAHAEMQRVVDAYYRMFTGAVAKQRDTDVATVLSDFGQGRMVLAKDAVKAGMADRVGTLEDTVGRLVGARSGRVPVEVRKAIASHSTATTDEPWDGPAAVAAMPNEAETLRYCHAWRDDEGDPDAKASYKFPHHKTNGGPANVSACNNGKARLPGSKIPEADKSGVERHLQRHLDDAEKSGASGMTFRDRVEFHRSLKREERRPAELRDRLRPTIRSTDDGPVIEGFACVYDVEYSVFDRLGEYTESVAPGAATKTLRESPDVRYLVNHEGVPLARTAAGTLLLTQRDEGLWYETVPLDMKNPKAQEIVSAIGRGDVDGSSFAFRTTRQEWSEDYTKRRILEIGLHDGDVSSVTYPANPRTSSGLRATDLVRRLATTELDELLVEARGRDELTGQIAMAAGRLQELLDSLAGERAQGRRDSRSTLSLDMADRDLELLELGAR